MKAKTVQELELTVILLGRHGQRDSVIIMCYYRPPNCHSQHVLRDEIAAISQAHPSSEIILVGDVNLPHIDWTTMRVKQQCGNKLLHQTFIDTLTEFHLTQLVREPTHDKGNTLDLVCCSNPERLTDLSVISPGMSDHAMIEFRVKVSSPQVPTATKEVKLYNSVNQELFCKRLVATKDQMETMSDAEEVWKYFSKELEAIVTECIPTTTLTARPANEPPWFTKEAKKAVTKHRRTYNLYKRHQDPFLHERYREERRHSKRLLKATKAKYILDKIALPLEEGNSKPFFSHMKKLKGSHDSDLELEQEDGTISQDNKVNANTLNTFFGQQFCTTHQLSDGPKPTGKPTTTITVPGVLQLLKNLKTGKAPGPDGIGKKVLLIEPDLMAECLTLVFNLSYAQGCLPSGWKEANVTVIHKKGVKTQACNYRPISLTSIPCKIMEHIILHELNKTLDTVLSVRQHGFRRGLSCETQLCSTFHDIVKTVDAGTEVHAVLLDFKKAFDTVPHGLLLEKLSDLQLDPFLLAWIRAFLTKRTQKVVLNGQCSQTIPVSSGVPQGSVLGPALFLVFINDLPEWVDCEVSLYADDTMMFQPVHNQEDTERFQNNIDRLHQWSNQWNMAFNASKCAVMRFGNRCKFTPSYTLGSEKLELVSRYKYLGVILQDDLRFDDHIQTKNSMCLRNLGLVRRCLTGAPKKAKLIAYKTLCLPHLEFACQVWDPIRRKDVELLERTHRKAVRFVASLRGRQSVTDAMKDLEMKSLEDKRKACRLRLMMSITREDYLPLTSAFNDIMDNIDRQCIQIQTRASSQRIPNSITTNTSLYHNSFLPRTVREFKDKLGIE